VEGVGEGLETVEEEEGLADFPLDDPGGATDRVDTGGEQQELNE
jgi:hypothetical protein